MPMASGTTLMLLSCIESSVSSVIRHIGEGNRRSAISSKCKIPVLELYATWFRYACLCGQPFATTYVGGDSITSESRFSFLMFCRAAISSGSAGMGLAIKVISTRLFNLLTAAGSECN